jgi:lipopolysaccharide biosynthesis glycosyltransferase
MHRPWSLVLAFDRHYVLPAAVCLRSIDAHVEDPPADVYIVAEELLPQDAALLAGQVAKAPVTVIPATSPLTTFGAHADAAHATTAQFLKCLAPKLLRGAQDRLVYIDADTLVLGDLGRLAQTDFGGNIAGFVPDRFVTSNAIDPGDHPYFNAGLFVTDRSAWNANRITEDILATITAHADRLAYGDQDALNKALRGAIHPLAGRWNYMLSEREKVDPQRHISRRVEDVSILHFCGPVKPWRTRLGHPYLRDLYDTYLTAVGPAP